MQKHPFPAAITDWTQETITKLAEREYPENTYLEYKRHLRYQDHDDTTKTEWRRDLEREFTAFGNASGGFVVFGMADDRTPHGIELPDHEVSQSVTQLVIETAPPLQTEVETIEPPHGKGDRTLVVVEVPEADRKPVATSDSTYAVRINDHKEPMNREQLESLFIEADRRQQAVQRLEFELEGFLVTYRKTFDGCERCDALPEYQLIDTDGLKEAFRQTTHLYTDDRVADTIQGILSKLRDIESSNRHYDRVEKHIGPSAYADRSHLNKELRTKLGNDVDRLHQLIRRLNKLTDLSIEAEPSVP